MKKKNVRRIAWGLILALVLSVVPVESVWAAQLSEDTGSDEILEESVEEPVEESVEETDTEKATEEVTENPTNTQTESLIQYIFVDRPEMQEGEEQTIVISLAENLENVGSLELYIKDEAGNICSIQSEKNEEGVYLFRQTFSKGVYYIDSVKMEVDGAETILNMSEIEINACFSVGVECPEEEKSEHIEVESIPEEEPTEETSVITIEEDGTIDSENTIAEALEVAAENADVPQAASYSARTIKEDIVIVLDPGHDSTHTGACYDEIKEHVPTLKIAQYCKEELEKYDGVKVYLTRETSACPYPDSSNNIDDIKKRVKAAYQKGADAFVSIHLNANDSTDQKGAEVYYYSSNSTGKGLSQKVQNELEEIGLYDRGIKKNDNYAVTKTAESYGFPGIIVEHAFLSNKSDVSNYLNSNTKLKKLGVADATGIAEYYGLKKIGTKVSMDEAVYTVTNASVSEQILGVTEEQVPFWSAFEGLASQRFELISAGDNYYYIAVEETGKVLTVADGNLQMEALEADNAYQKWAFIKADTGIYYLYSKCGLYLAALEEEIGLAEKETTSAYQWKFERASYRSIEGLTPKLVSAKNSDGNVVVKWKELTGAEGYQILRKTSGTDWKTVGTVKSETTTSYTDKTAPESTKCTYTVKAYKGETESLYNETGVSVTTPAKITYIKYRTTTSVNYRKGPGTSSTKAGTLSKGKVIEVEKGYSKTVNGLKWYRFKLNSKNYYIAAKYLSKVVILSKPVLSSVKYSNGTNTVNWKAVSKAKGYYIYRKTGSGSYTRIGTVKSGSTVKYKDSSIKAGQKYTYKIKAYNGSDKSSYSSTKSITTPNPILVKYKATTKVKYRSGAGTKYSVKGTLVKGKTVYVVKGWSKKANGYTWYKVKISGKYYYVASKYLKKA